MNSGDIIRRESEQTSMWCPIKRKQLELAKGAKQMAVEKVSTGAASGSNTSQPVVSIEEVATAFSRHRVPQGAFGRLEPYEVKASRTVLKGGAGGNVGSLPGAGAASENRMPSR